VVEEILPVQNSSLALNMLPPPADDLTLLARLLLGSSFHTENESRHPTKGTINNIIILLLMLFASCYNTSSIITKNGVTIFKAHLDVSTKTFVFM
jgi:hypothetical protein